MTDAEALEPDRATEPESYVISLDTGERIQYLDWGDPPPRARSLPPLVLLHGITQTGWIWAPVARRLRRQTRVLAPDLRGHGLSDAARSGYSLESLALDMLTVLSGNRWGSDVGGPPAAVVGHGFGAQVAATMARMRPGSIAGVGLVDGGWEDVAEATRLSPAEMLAALAEPPDVLSSLDAFFADRRDFDPATWDDDQQRAARAQVDQKYAGHVAFVSREAALRGFVDAMFEYRPDVVLARVQAPLLVLVAEAATADDEGARERRLALGDAVRVRRDAGLSPPRIVRYPGAGHNLMRHRAAQVSAEILWLLRAASDATSRSDRADATGATSADTRGGPA